MIPSTAGPSKPRPADWRLLWRDAITDPAELLALLGLPTLAGRLARDGLSFPLRVPRGYVARMRPGDPDDPLLRQVLPLDDEDRPVPGFDLDAVGDLDARAGAGVLHKYAGRALLVTTGSCAIHCRYCFRRHFPYAQETAARGRWREALAILAADPGIHEVLLSGGDPLSLSNEKLEELLAGLAAIGHVRRLRIHTRLPIVLPERVDEGLAGLVADAPWPVTVVVHANHPRELDDHTARALARLRAAGAHLLNQAVLLRGVNDDAATLAALSEDLFDQGVLPYYLHLLDRVHGTAHFEVPESRARELEAALRARLPGYLLPRFVREIAGENAKSPAFAT